jgi:hypothetical protein
MKKKLFSIVGALAGLLALGLGLAGCATTGGSGASPSPDKQAQQLAANLGGESKATVDGATVKLTGAVYLTTGLTVPAGVTLDLTAVGAKFELQNGAKLTVDGTVNTSGHGDHGKGWVDGALRMGDGTAVINGSGTIRLQSKGRLLNIGGDKKHLTLDGVTLVGLADNDNSLVQVDGGGAFTMKSGKISGNTVNGGDNAWGGGVEVQDGSVFTMEGGAITGNTAQGRYAGGGGVRINHDSTFTMTGGTISGNSVQGSGSSGGGGVRIDNDSTFTMTGGTISGNTDQGTNGGGGVYISSGTFRMTDGTISGNSAIGGGGGGGGGVRTTDGTFAMEGGTISGNSASDHGGGVDIYKLGTFTKSGGIIYGSNETRNDANDNPLKNTAPNGNAVYISSSPVKQRNTTAGEDVSMDSSKSGGAGGWE